MSVTERLMKPGQFTVRLSTSKGVSRAAYDACRLFDHIVITATRPHPIDGFSDANILARAMYTGIIKDRPDMQTVSGPGLADWFGTEEGRGDLLDTPVANQSGTLSTWATSLRPASLAAGTVTNTSYSYTGQYQWMTRREAFTHVCRQVGAEWRINPNFTLDAGASSTLFVSTPTAVVTRLEQSSEGSLRGVQAQELVAANDVRGYVQKMIVVGKNGDGAPVATGTSSSSNVYKDGLNNDVVMEQFVDAPTEPSGNLNTYASALLTLNNVARTPITVSTDMFAVPFTIKPGDNVYVYDPDTGTVDRSNQIQWRGETVTPAILRCQSVTWAIVKGMGVYARTSAGVYYDLSDAVEYETELSSFELGGGAFDPRLDPTQHAAAFLGVNPDIVARLSASPMSDSPRNKILNGELQVWQRGGGSFTVDGYTADGWYGYSSGSTYVTTRQSFAAGNTISGQEAKHYLRCVVTSVANTNNFVSLFPIVESSRTLAGQQATLSFWAKADATKNVGILLYRGFGAGGSPSTDDQLDLGLVSLTTSWARKQITFTVPTISGKTLGSTHDGYLGFIIYLDAGATAYGGGLGQQSGTFEFFGLQLEAGAVASSLERHSYADDLQACQRTYQRHTQPRLVGITGAGANPVLGRMGMQLNPPMRATPTVSISAALPIFDGVNTGTLTGIITSYSTANVIELDCNSTIVAGDASRGIVTYQNGSNYLEATAEL